MKIYGIFVSKNGTRMDPKEFFNDKEELEIYGPCSRLVLGQVIPIRIQVDI